MRNIRRELTTARCILRLVQHSDLEFVYDLLSKPETDAFNTLGIPQNMADTSLILQKMVNENKDGRQFTYLLTTKGSSQNIGLLGLSLRPEKYSAAEIWFKIHPGYWSQGFATEAATGLLRYALTDLNLHRVQAGCAVENAASIKVLEKIGMVREGRGRQVLPLKSGWSDNFEYGILKTEFQNPQA